MEADYNTWLQAQREERVCHDSELYEDRLAHYVTVYRHYFNYLHIPAADLGYRSVIEIGPADFPAVMFCNQDHIKEVTIIEPMPSEILESHCRRYSFGLIKAPAEELWFPQYDECWIFNVLQHVISPEAIINKAKAACKVIRFFEPIDSQIDSKHLHTFDLAFFEKHFGECTTFYTAPEGIERFFRGRCAYGVYHTNKL